MTSKTYEPLSFDLDLTEIPVTLRNSKTGAVEEFVLRELDGRQRDRYLNAVNARTKSLPDGSARITDFDGLQGDLLTRSMFRVVDGEVAKEPVTMAVVQTWPAKVQAKLFEQSRELSGLDDGAEDDSKNDS